jgi:hypothetical protein
MEYYVGFNTSVKDWVEEFRFQEILESEGLGDLDPFSDEGQEALDGWGFSIPTWFEQSEEELLLQERPDIFQGRRLEAEAKTLWETGNDGEIWISKSHPALKILLDKIWPSGYFDEGMKPISKEEFFEKLKTKEDYDVYVCELEPPC